MSLPELPANASRHELRKALIQMRLELHRQELRQETLQALQPLQQVRDFSQHCRTALQSKSAPLWGAAALLGVGVLIARRSQVQRWLGVASALAPLLIELLRRPSPASKPPEQ